MVFEFFFVGIWNDCEGYEVLISIGVDIWFGWWLLILGEWECD